MAFCSVTEANVERLNLDIRIMILDNPESLRNFRDFTQGVIQYLLGKGVPVEKALTLAKYIPDAISGFNLDRTNRDLLRRAGVSLDAIRDVEDQFDTYEGIAKFVGIKNESKPVVVVNTNQLAQEDKITKHNAATNVTFEGNIRVINNKKYNTRVTSIAKVGFTDPADEEREEEVVITPALKHGNTVDTIAKAIFDGENPKFENFQELIERNAFDSLVSNLKSLKATMEQQGYVFKTAVTLYNSLGMSGEADLVAINAEGQALIMDFKTAAQRFNETYLKTESLIFRSDKTAHEMNILSKWRQYGTQGYIYGLMLSEQLGIPLVERTGIIGINIGYDKNLPADQSRITKVIEVELHNISHSEVRPEYKGKNITEIYNTFQTLKGQELGSVTEVKPRRVFKSGRTPRDLDRIAAINEIAATDAQLQEEVDWITRSPLGKGLLLNMSNMVNTGLFGNFKLDGITIYKNASQGTVYHEGWHRFSQVFMTPDQKMDLYTSVKEDAIPFRTRDGRNTNTADAEFIDVEEFLAEQFAKYALNPTDYTYPKPKSSNPVIRLFQAIWEFLQRYFSNNPRPIDLFHKLYTGKIADYVPSVNNAFWGNLNSLATNLKGEEIVSNERLPLYVRSMDYLIGKQLRDANKSFTAFRQSKRLQSSVLENVSLILEAIQNDPTRTDQQANELYSILESWPDFLRVYLTATEYKTLKDFTIDEDVFIMSTEELAAIEDIREQYDDVEDIDESPDEDSKPERFDRTGNEDSAFSVADDAIQDFFRTVPKIKSINPDGTFVYELNELGLPENHKFYDVFYKTKKVLAGALEMSEMKALMQDPYNQAIFPELSIVNDFMSKFMQANNEEKNFRRAVQNVQFVQSFYHVMVMPEVPNMQLTLNYLPLTRNYQTFRPTTVSYRPASRSLSLKIIKTWEKNFKDIRGKIYAGYKTWEDSAKTIGSTPLYLTEDGKMFLNPFIDYNRKYPAGMEGLRLFWLDMGVTLNPKVFKDKRATDELSEAKRILISNIGTYRNSVEKEVLATGITIFSELDLGSTPKNPIQVFEGLPQFFMDTLVKNYFIGNPVTFFNDKRLYKISVERNGAIVESEQTTAPMRFLYEHLAGIEERFGDRVSSGSFKIEDKTKYPYYIPNQLLITTGLINRVQNTSQFADNIYMDNLDPVKNPWVGRSYFMKRMFDTSGNRQMGTDKNPVSILVEDIASVSNISEDGILEKAPRSLTKDEKFFMDVMTLFKTGAIEIPRAETSSTTFSIRLSDYGRGKNLPLTLEEVLPKAGVKIPQLFHDIVKDYFAAEIEKRQWFLNNDPEVVGANKKPLSQQFNVFEGILPQELKDKVVANLDKTPEQIFEIEGLLGEFRAAIDEYFTTQIEAIKPRFTGSKISINDDQQTMIRDVLESKNMSMASAARLFVLNHFILSQEFYNLYFGDLYFYKNAFKRGKYVTNTGNTFYIDDTRNQMLNSIQGTTLHSIFTGTKPGGKDFRYMNTSIIEDVEMKSSYVDDEDSKNMILQGILAGRIASGALAPNTPTYAKFITDTKKSLEKYYSINIADGQGIIGLDFYRNFSIMTKIWDDKKESEYERQKAIFRNHYDLYFKLDANGNKIRMEGEELEEARSADVALRNQRAFAIFNPLKISYTGPQVKDGPTRPVFDKFSVRPMIPEAAIGKRDESLLLEMTKKDMDYVKFRSGSKVYQDTSFNWYNQISDGIYNLDDFSTEEIEPNQLFAGFLKHQLNTEGFKDENIFGSQFRKIVFGVKYSAMVRNNPALLTNFTNLETKFKKTIDELIEVEQRDLFTLLGVTQVGNSYRVTDMKKFLKLLQAESVRRGVAVNNIDYIQYDEATRNAKYPIDYAFNRQQIQDLISGLLDDRLRRLKVKGSSLIQVSSAGSESKSQKFTNPTEEDIRRYGTNGLHYYHVVYDNEGKPIRTSTMGVKVALDKDFRNLLQLPAPASLGVSNRTVRLENQVLQTEAVLKPGKIQEPGMSEEEAIIRLNQAMKDPEWKAKHMDKFIMVGYRIPTQNINFIDYMEVMEFLPKSAGSIIIAPPELIIKSGSDFDIDKMNIMRMSINRQGALTRMPRSKVAEGVTEEDTLDYIFSKIEEQVYTEKELKKLISQLDNVMDNAAMDINDLERIQKRIRMSMLDLAMKSDVISEGYTRVIDMIIENMEEGKPSALPDEDQLKSDEEAFTDEEVADIQMELQRVTAEFQLYDQRIEGLKERYSDTAKEKGGFEAGELQWFNKKRDYKLAKGNELITTLSQLMSHPYYFELLVTPSSAENFETFTNELIASQQNMTPEQFAQALSETDNKLYDRSLTPEQTSRYESTLESFDNLLSKRKDLGGYAIQRTFSDIFNFAKFSLSRVYTVPVGKDYKSKVIYTPLIPVTDRDKVVQNGRILMYGDSVSGIPISKSFDELISLTVDLAGSPAYPYIGINNFNKKHVQYLLHQKTDPKQVIWFMNQPVLKELFRKYEERRRKVVGYTLKHAIVELALSMRILDNPQVFPNSPIRKYEVLELEKVDPIYDDWGDIEVEGYSLPNQKQANPYLSKPYWDLHEQNLNETDDFSFEVMDAAIRSGETNTDFQRKVLAYFASMTDEADMVTKLQFAENVDTTKYATLTSLIKNELNRKEIRLTDLFDNNQIDRIEKESMIAPFDYTQKAKGILKALFPKLYTNETINAFAALVTDVWGAKNTQVERISKIVENDFIEYVYKNYGSYNGQNLSDYFQNQLINMDAVDNHQYFVYRLNSIKSQFPELSTIPFVAALYEDVYFPPDNAIENSYKGLDNREIHNTFFLRNPDNPTFEKNIFTSNWRNLIDFDPERLGLSETYTSEDINKIADFFHELVFFSLYQSGLTNTGNGFSDLIPYEQWAPFIQQAFDAYEADKSKSRDLEHVFLTEFQYRFRQMNPKVNWRTKKRALAEKDEKTGRNKTVPLEFYKNYYRGKDYRVTDDDLMLARDMYLLPNPDSDPNTDTLPDEGPTKVPNVGEFTPGRYAEGEGNRVVLISELSPGVWQVYNPYIEGSKAKTVLRVDQLTTLNQTAPLVTYNGKQYIVTDNQQIIDIAANKKVTWATTNQNRINILRLAEEGSNPDSGSINPPDQPPTDPVC